MAMKAFGVPRFDAGAEGIHLVWSWPDVLPLSLGGYDVQRLQSREQQLPARCEDIDQSIILYLRSHNVFAAPLGPLRFTAGARFDLIFKPASLPLAAPDPSVTLPGELSTHELVHAALQNAVSSAAASFRATDLAFDVFTQELESPVDRATVEVEGRIAVALAMSAGKIVQVAPSTSMPAYLNLEGPSIDTVVVYVLSPQHLRICVYERPKSDKSDDDPVWGNAPYIARGLTLPIQEADPALTTPAAEYATATGRLTSGEKLMQADFQRLVPALRDAAGTGTLGRSGERVVLVRATTDQSYEELPFETQLGALALHPKLRRVLGFGFRDHKSLVAGQSYLYRITGHFLAEDLTDAIYDVHRIPAATTLPAAFSIRDLSLRFQTPVKVILDPPPSAAALHSASRRGIRIDTTAYDSSWVLPFLDNWSAVIGFPQPVSSLVLEVARGHNFHYAAGLPWAFGSPAPIALAAGPVVQLKFFSPIMELRLSGSGTLYAVRISSGVTGKVAVHAYVGPITYAPQPLPLPPVVLAIDGLQQPATPLTGPIDESTAVPTRPPIGFKLHWLPATVAGLSVWPDDLDAGPPLDALAYQIRHRVVTGALTYGQWEPIAADDNLTLGSRDAGSPSVRLEFGCDLDALFPAVRPRSSGAGFALQLSDVFGESDPTTGKIERPVQPLGSYHQYDILAMDAVGRIGGVSTLSNIARLEKHIPPPMPVGPQPEPPLNDTGHLTAPPGARARAILAGAPGLTANDIALLGGHHNAIVLEWGWRQSERDLDPTASEFRVYATVPQDFVMATIQSVASPSPYWRVALTTNVPLTAEELVGQWLTCNGYPFRIAHNDGGTTPTLQLEISTLQPTRQPIPGPVTFGRPLQPVHQRPRGWDQRVAVHPLTAADTYSHVFYDMLNLSVAHSRDAIWVGVSTADDQSYVSDERTLGANANRAGNESAIATCAIAARYRGQPVFSIPPPLGDVPELVTDEPTGRQVLVSLDLGALLAGALPVGASIVVERCPVDTIISHVSLAGGDVVLTQSDGTGQVIPFPNPVDAAAVAATLNSANPNRLVNKYVLHLVAAATNPDVYFERISDDILPMGLVTDRLAPKPGRYLYLVRAADALGHISDGGGILPLIVRVPSTASATTPRKRTLIATDTSVTLGVALSGTDPDTQTALLFAVISPPGANPAPQGEAEFLRVPNRRDLYPTDGIRLRLADGTLLTPSLVKNLTDPDVTVEADGTRVAQLQLPAAKGSWVSLWCFAITRDGQASNPCGPFGMGVHA